MYAATLLETLSKGWPNVQVSCYGNPDHYEDLVWSAGDAIPPEADIRARAVEFAKLEQIEFLSNECQKDITSGFESSTLGTPHIYDSEEVDQLNLIGAYTTVLGIPSEDPEGYSIPYACRPIIDGVIQPKVYKPHSRNAFARAMVDGSQVKLAKLQKFNYKRNWINNNAVTVEDIHAVTWASVE